MTLSDKHKKRMLDVAHLVSTWSDCPTGRKHGCVLALQGKYIISTGYNGMKRSCPIHVCQTLTREDMRKNCLATHAEENAIKNLMVIPTPPYWFVAFVTKRPCEACENKLRDAGVSEVFWQERASDGTVITGGSKKL